jgi:hypothetical protein
MPDSQQQIMATLARIEERVANIQQDVAEINNSRHCATHAEKIKHIEQQQLSVNAKSWAALLLVIGGWVKMVFWTPQ